jgi:glycosyltransferase involved in cell wall biosynthesis
VRIAILMPAFNEERRVAKTLAELADVFLPEPPRAGSPARERHELTLFLVDDGSAPPVDEASLLAAARGLDVIVARHGVNLGQGAALETARRLALAEDGRRAPRAFDAYVTMDSDGQHRAEDVVRIADAVHDGADVALGDRFAGGSAVPRSRALLLRLARAFERVTTGLALSDAHNGLRGFSRAALDQVHIRQNRMAHATELTRHISRARLRVVEVPVSVRYTAATLAKGQRASGAIAILLDLLHGFLFEERS